MIGIFLTLANDAVYENLHLSEWTFYTTVCNQDTVNFN